MSLEKPKSVLNQIVDESKQQNKRIENIKSETIDVEANLEGGPENVTIDFMNQDSVNEFVKESSNEAKEEKKSNRPKQTIDDIKSQIVQEEAAASNFTAEEMADIAEVICSVIDMGISAGFRFWAGDSSDSAYSITVGKRSMLNKQMTMILVKYQVKFKIEFLFLLSLVVVYSVPFMKAREIRGRRKAAEKQIATKKANKEATRLETPPNSELVEQEEEIEEAEVIVDAAETITTTSPIKRTRRRPRR
jgi:hypothetical protein